MRAAKRLCLHCGQRGEHVCTARKRTRRPSAHARGYNYRWRQERRRYLQANPLCVACDQVGKTSAATVVDHITPHKGNERLFWDVANWQALCKRCHDRKTATGL